MITLPDSYPRIHAWPKDRRIAQENLALLAEVGSGVHGTALAGTDDRDEMGFCFEPAEYVFGLGQFEQFERHTAWDGPDGVFAKSGPGDLDVTVYSARKWARMAVAGNPSALVLAFTPDSAVVFETAAGRELRENGHRFASVKAGDRFLGYLNNQRRSMAGDRAVRVNRPELVSAHGYDTKFGAHALRLGFQGAEFLKTGRFTLPMPAEELEQVRAVRRGEVPIEEVLRQVAALEAEIELLVAARYVPDVPDVAWIGDWLLRHYTEAWE